MRSSEGVGVPGYAGWPVSSTPKRWQVLPVRGLTKTPFAEELLFSVAFGWNTTYLSTRTYLSRTCATMLRMREITQRQLRNESGEIMRELDRGESFLVTRNGTPVGELVPIR